MKSGYQSRIEADPETGGKYLIVFYNAELDDFNEAVQQAIAFHGIRPGQMNVIALTENLDMHLRPIP